MPWTPKQHRMFEAAAHDPKVAHRVGIPTNTAKMMAAEGVKHVNPSHAHLLRGR